MANDQQQTPLAKVKDLGADSTTKDILDAGDALAGVYIQSMKYEYAWRKVGFLLQRQQHEQMANLTRWLTWATWGVAIATGLLVLGTDIVK
jgi:hypothetical protein